MGTPIAENLRGFPHFPWRQCVLRKIAEAVADLDVVRSRICECKGEGQERRRSLRSR
jgi:hypothetical protein